MLRVRRRRREAEQVERQPRRVLIILENLPIERDTRVRKECRALTEAGYGVSVICPKGGDPETSDDLRDVVVHRYPSPRQPSSRLGFLYEFAYSWACTAALALKVLRTHGFDILQSCNPPDTYFALALPFKLLGKPFVFDHHDLSPELYAIRFGRDRGLVLVLLRVLERATFLTADHVISTNESIRHVALTRGGKPANDITVVRNGPELSRIWAGSARPELKRGKAFLCCWVGVMGSVDDGVDLGLAAVEHIVRVRGRHDCHFAFLGAGEAFEHMTSLVERLGIGDVVSFPGWVPPQIVGHYLASADVGLQPDPKNPRTDLATASKTMEYMAYGLPVVAFDVHETKVSAADAAVYAEPNDPVAFGDLVVSLLDDPDRRARMGDLGRRRVEEKLAWEHQKTKYVSVFDRLSAT